MPNSSKYIDLTLGEQSVVLDVAGHSGVSAALMLGNWFQLIWTHADHIMRTNKPLIAVRYHPYECYLVRGEDEAVIKRTNAGFEKVQVLSIDKGITFDLFEGNQGLAQVYGKVLHYMVQEAYDQKLRPMWHMSARLEFTVTPRVAFS